ncbi:hypothetical protein EUTSA_v10005476mg [Eutrema salsugineum]|uniref:SAM domain-containing protein n=1 Tax=Eutrema salsugineum TaxID=72664 RepID=V4KPM6_EUTSA|nr:protein bicaudal C homolog 1-B [Eutrema salsugineum]ESQ31917.1 hypothetical protein EUTSA_v10005476mg [Eutrema salsugineum]
MAELQQLVEGHQTNGGFIPPAITLTEAPETSAAVSAGVSVGSKRLRRPSVRLGDIGGDQYQHMAAYDSHVRRPKWRPPGNRKESNQSGKSSSRTRTLTNLSSSTGTLDEDPIAVGTWRVNKWVKSSGGETTTTATAKRVRSNWATKMEEHRDGLEQGDDKFSGGEGEEEDEEEDEEELEEGFRDFSREDSESPMKEQTQENRNEREVFENRRRYENREVEMSGDWQSGGRGREGVKIWLQELGLGRYWPMFEMHEVDEEVLPLLTLEDLKDMGINAVGSRRKMYCAIQKLGREFS